VLHKKAVISGKFNMEKLLKELWTATLIGLIGIDMKKIDFS
jgi:hypothetical protein